MIESHDWEITGATMPELQGKLATGLEELAENLEGVVQFLRFRTKIHRLEAEHEAYRR